MLKSCRIIIADDDESARHLLCIQLERLGHQVIGVASDGEELIALCRKSNPDLILTDIRMPGTDGLEAIERIADRTPLPCVLVSAFIDEHLIARASASPVFAYLTKPFRTDELSAAIAVARQRFQEFKRLVEETNATKQALDDRKHIERAKGLLMTRHAMDEACAFRHLQHIARSRRIKMIDAAKRVNEGAYSIPADFEC